MYIFTMPAEEFDERNPDKQKILELIKKHHHSVPHLNKLLRYYEGHHKIEHEERENKLICNHAKDIADTASSYFIGNPVSYTCENDISILTDALENAGADEADGDNGLDLSIYGRAYEYIYAKEGEAELNMKNLPPQNTFMVYDDTIEQKELFAVYYHVKKDDTGEADKEYIATVLTHHYKYELKISAAGGSGNAIEEPTEHHMDGIPVIEYLNNKLAIGDYELQIPLIDAYNALMSDRITDKEQFIDAILALYGALLGDDDSDEEGKSETVKTAKKRLKDEKLLELPADARAEYITRTFDESGVEILKKAIEQDIHKFSHVPCMTDEAFGGNVSGVAMEFKLLGLENITKIKTRYYKKGLRKRLRLFSNYLGKKGQSVDASKVKPAFTRALPKNLVEIAQYVSALWGKVSKKTLLGQIPFVEDVDAELEAVEQENQKTLEQQQKMFGNEQNTPVKEEEDGETKLLGDAAGAKHV